MDPQEEQINSLIVELKRGTQVLIVLSQLRTPEYGYSLVQKLAAREVPIEAGTLYPMLRRLEKQALLSSEWDTSESRPRKFYVLNQAGRLLLDRLKQEWRTMAGLMDTLLEEEENHGTN